MEHLTRLERLILKVLLSSNRPLTVYEISQRAGIPENSVNSVLELLKSKGLVSVEEEVTIYYTLTKEGRKVLEEGFPEESLLSIMEDKSEESIQSLKKRMNEKILGIALGAAKRRGLIRVEKGKVILLSKDTSRIEEEKRLLEKIAEQKIIGLNTIAEDLRKRGLVERKISKTRRVRASEKAKTFLEKQGELVSRLSSRDLVTGEWKKIALKPYNVQAKPPYYPQGLPHFYIQFIKIIREILFEMGFREEQGPFIETEFWNFDVLFQAQDHPAREVHDTFWIDLDKLEIDASKELVERTKMVHETGGKSGSKGWGGVWSKSIASRPILRTQMTCVSARILSKHPEPPFRYFAIGPVFRPDVIDSRHLPNFYQLDGIISEENMSFSKLLGVLKEFFERLGLEKIRFKPGYFPFTEPSVEGYAFIPGVGWTEVFGAGMFRPEVLEILGVEYDVGAWGIGLDRLAMSLFRIPDIRLLYTRDVSELKALYKKYLDFQVRLYERL